MRRAMHAMAPPMEPGIVRGRIGKAELLVLHTGIGRAAASHRVEAVLQTHTPQFLISAGFAGGLDPELRVGDIVVAENHSTPELLPPRRSVAGSLGERVFFGSLLTAEQPAESPEEKRRLRERSGAMAVDMETEAIATICAAASVPFLAARAISDAAVAALPLPFAISYDLARQRPRLAAVLGFLATRPQRIPALVSFLRDMRVARIELTRFLLGFCSALD